MSVAKLIPTATIDDDSEKEESVDSTEIVIAGGGYQANGTVAAGRENPFGERIGNKWQVVKYTLFVVLFALLIAVLATLGIITGVMLNGFQSSIDEMKAQMSIPGRFYQNCHQATSSCELTDMNQPNAYTRQCATPYMRVNATVSMHTDSGTQ